MRWALSSVMPAGTQGACSWHDDVDNLRSQQPRRCAGPAAFARAAAPGHLKPRYPGAAAPPSGPSRAAGREKHRDDGDRSAIISKKPAFINYTRIPAAPMDRAGSDNLNTRGSFAQVPSLHARYDTYDEGALSTCRPAQPAKGHRGIAMHAAVKHTGSRKTRDTMQQRQRKKDWESTEQSTVDDHKNRIRVHRRFRTPSLPTSPGRLAPDNCRLESRELLQAGKKGRLQIAVTPTGKHWHQRHERGGDLEAPGFHKVAPY
ncbi:hypothetical protein B0T11DRAFT_318025 [Plectosphaerella cucumerina]|uniref:Uncharacterized protein n=1 Tax=Plectosphaerella cucumerina TaxID=40658 RepID=A0A8K0TL95_9PEZI|nr:hypothetical protein B0T11DRAFT_318025 [Plectosphaerella cucumerina]